MHLGRSWWPSSPPSPSLTPSNHPPKKMITRKKNHTLCPLSHSCQQWVFRGKLLQALMRLKEELGQESAPVCAGLELNGSRFLRCPASGEGPPSLRLSRPLSGGADSEKDKSGGPRGCGHRRGTGLSTCGGISWAARGRPPVLRAEAARARASPEVEERWAAGSCKSTWRAGGVLSVAGGRGAVASRWGGTGKGLPSALPAERGGAGRGTRLPHRRTRIPEGACGRAWPSAFIWKWVVEPEDWRVGNVPWSPQSRQTGQSFRWGPCKAFFPLVLVLLIKAAPGVSQCLQNRLLFYTYLVSDGNAQMTLHPFCTSSPGE